MAVRVVLNRSGIGQVLKSQALRSELERRAQAIAAASGPEFAAKSSIGRTRALALAYTASDEGVAAESDRAALSRGIDAGRQ